MLIYLELHGRDLKNFGKITIRLSKNELRGPGEQLMLTKTQINKIRKAIQNGSGSDIKISKTQIRKVVKQGGALWSSLLPLAGKVLPMATNLISKAAVPLATGAMHALGSLGKGQG